MTRTLSASLPLPALAAIGIAMVSSVALADSAQAFSLSINPNFGSTENTGSTATLDYNFEQQGDSVLLKLGIANTTNGSVGLGATQSTLVGVALDLLAGGVTSFTYDSLSSAFTNTYTDPSIPGLASNYSFDYGIRSAGPGNFTGGNPQQGLTVGQSTLVSFLLSGSSPLVASAVESAFLNGYTSGDLKAAGRFQQVNAGGGSDKVLGGVNQPTQPVPEPGSVMGLFTVLGALLLGKKTLRREASQN